MMIKKRLRVMPIVMTVMMVFAMMPIIGAVAYADESYELWVGTEKVTTEKTSGEGWKYDASSNTMTLTNAEITAGHYFNPGYSAGIYYDGSEELNIVLAGSNSISLPTSEHRYGICSTKGDINISGDGSLTAMVGDNAIYASGGNVTIAGGDITAYRVDAGIWADGTVSISGGSLTVRQCENGIVCDTLSMSDGAVKVTESGPAILASGGITIGGGTVTATTLADYYNIDSQGKISITGGKVTATGYKGGISGKSIEIRGGVVEASGTTAGLYAVRTDAESGDVKIIGGTVTASGAPAIRADRNVEIEGGTVNATATGDNGNAIYAAYLIELKGGSVTASGTGTGSGIYANGGINEIGKNVRIRAGDDESSATDVTYEFKTKFAQYKWVQTETVTLWVAGIPVTSRNAENILGDAGASASYDADRETLTLDGYSCENEGHRFDDLNNFYAAIYAEQDLMIRLVGKNTVKCTEKEDSVGFGIFSNGKAITISGNGTLNAAGYGKKGIGIFTSHEKNITINGGTVTASGDNGLSANGGSVIINDGIVTAIGSSNDLGISADSIVVADKMGINAGDSKETAIAVDKKDFETNHPQHWVQIAKAYPLWVRGTWVMVTNEDDVLGDGKVSYDPDTNTLKLDGADIKADMDHQHGDAAICCEDEKNELIIDAAKASSVKGPDYDNSEGKSSYGIFSKGPLTVKGKLTATGKDFGFFLDNGQVTVGSAAELNVTGNTVAGIGSIGDSAVIINEGAKLVAVGGVNGAIDAIVKNDVVGIGWTDIEGSKGKTEFKVNKQGQNPDDKIRKAVFPASAAAVSKAPAAKSLTYNGSAQELVTVGTAKNGTMKYAIGKDNKTAPISGWSASVPKGITAGTYYVWYKAIGDEKHIDSEPKCVAATIKSKPADKVSGTLTAKTVASGNTAMNISWTKVKGASGYDVYFAKCGTPIKKIKTVKAGKSLKCTQKGLKAKSSYRTYVKAYVIRNGKKTYVRTSPTLHAYTGGTKSYTNAKSVSVNKTSVALKKGKTFKIKASVQKVNSKKKLMADSHAPKLRYLTSNNKVASVDKSGKIKARSKGACVIYVYAHNGVSKQIKVTVK